MANTTANEVVTQGHKRSYLQYGGASPENAITFAGVDGQYMVIEGLSIPQSGGIDPIYVPDPLRLKKYKIVSMKETPPDLAEATLKLLEKHGSIPKALTKQGCRVNAYEVTGNCRDLSDFDNGWSDYVLIYSGGVVTDIDGGDRQSWDSDDQVENSLSVTWADIYPVGALSFGNNAAAPVDREVIDVVFYPTYRCDDCGPANDGTQWQYAVTKPSGAGSPGLPAEIVYTTTGGASWLEATITGIGATAIPYALDIVGPYLVVVTQETNGALYFATINDTTGAVGSFTKVTSGFASGAAGLPTDIWVNGPRDVWLSGMNGYIYHTTDITTGVSVASAGSATSNHLRRIHGKNKVIVAVGDGATVVKSTNGQTFATTTAVPTGNNLQSVQVLSEYRFWVGSDSGVLSYTLDGGNGAWIVKAFSGSGAGVINDILAPTDEVLFFSHTLNGTARLFSSINSGVTITNTGSRIQNVPVADQFSRLATPNNGVSDLMANIVLVGGIAGDGTDGILLIGTAPRL